LVVSVCTQGRERKGVVGSWVWYEWSRINWDVILQWREIERQISVRETDLLKERIVIGRSLNNR
jgi:hypothetical protein